MSGIRLRHKDLRDINFTVVHHRRYKTPLYCAACDDTHIFKTYHLHLDADGEVVVSKVIYERLAELDGLPLTKVGVERKPKPIVLGMPVAGTHPEVKRARIEAFVPKSMREAVKG